MCQLLGMSANVPTDLAFSLTGLLERAGRCGPHRDGWGVALYADRHHLWRESTPGSESTLAQQLLAHPVKARIGIAHVRQANVGSVALENTHPFIREYAGRIWTFAHNGQLSALPEHPGPFRAVGQTDSEAAFVALLNRVAEAGFQRLEDARETVLDFADSLAPLGVFNFLLSDGETLLAFCAKKLSLLTRRAPFGVARLRDREDVVIDFSRYTTARDVVTVIATEPLTEDEPWQILQAGEWVLLRAGRVEMRGQAPCCVNGSNYEMPFPSFSRASW